MKKDHDYSVFFAIIAIYVSLDNQVERQDEMRKEYYEWLRKGVFDANNKH